MVHCLEEMFVFLRLSNVWRVKSNICLVLFIILHTYAFSERNLHWSSVGGGSDSDTVQDMHSLLWRIVYCGKKKNVGWSKNVISAVQKSSISVENLTPPDAAKVCSDGQHNP